MPLEVAVQGSTGPPVTLHSIVLPDRSAELALVLDIERGGYVKLNPGRICVLLLERQFSGAVPGPRGESGLLIPAAGGQ